MAFKAVAKIDRSLDNFPEKRTKTLTKKLYSTAFHEALSILKDSFMDSIKSLDRTTRINQFYTRFVVNFLPSWLSK